MGEQTQISWTNATWNPWHGCAKVSAGCKNCYMFREKKQYGQDPTLVVRSKTKFNDPLKWVKSGKTPRYCFTCSWSDFFIAQADLWRSDAWEVIRATPQITYQILTKRPERIAMGLPDDWGTGYPNVWLGVSVENRESKRRIDILRDVPATLRFLSLEPLLEDLGDLDLPGIGWAIAGGESGPGARPMHPNWARSVRDQCHAAAVPFFFKQWGEYAPFGVLPSESKLKGHTWDDGATWTSVAMVGTKKAGATLDGREWREFPKVCVPA